MDTEESSFKNDSGDLYHKRQDRIAASDRFHAKYAIILFIIGFIIGITIILAKMFR